MENLPVVRAIPGSFAEACGAARRAADIDGPEMARRVNKAAAEDLGLGERAWTRSRAYQIERSPTPVTEGTVRRYAAAIDADVYLVFAPKGAKRFVVEVAASEKEEP